MEFVEAAGLATYSTSEPTVISYASIFENFWNQAELHEQLKLHDKMQKEFINIASHELKTPVQSILGYSELLLEHPENFQKLAEGVRRNALRLEKLTNNILDVSRIDSNRLKLRKEVLNINEKIANVVKDLSLNSEIKINIIEPSVNPIVVEADKVRMYQVLSNLLTNAIKFSRIRRDEIPNAGHKAGNDITIYTEVRTSPRHEVVIAVKDRGTGITADFQDKLFSKFASKSEEGMGLGLFISRGIVEAHNGKIWAENNRDGGGATFAFSLPLDSA
jgi:signal transduction histidine kinase